MIEGKAVSGGEDGTSGGLLRYGVKEERAAGLERDTFWQAKAPRSGALRGRVIQTFM
jgi:hypothetical protein